MYKVLVITQDEFGLGFRLAGVKTHTVRNSEEAREELVEQLNSKEYGIVLIDEELTVDLDDKLRERILESTLPLVVLTPVRKEFEEEAVYSEDEFSKFIASTIGYQIRIR